MKNYSLIFLLVISLAGFQSCNQYRSISTATKVSQLSGNPFMYNLSKSLLKNTARYLVEKNITQAVGKLNLLTPLSSIITNPEHVGGYMSMLSTAYKIPAGKLAKSYNTLSTVKDLISFVGKNGESFNFYRN